MPCASFCVELLVMRMVQGVAMLMKYDCTGLPTSMESGCCTSVLGLLIMQMVQEVATLLKPDRTGLPSSIESACRTLCAAGKFSGCL